MQMRIGRGWIAIAALTLAYIALAGVAPERAAAVTDCALTAPANITTTTALNGATAVVSYPAPGTSGTCATVVCTPPSGSTYGLGVTLVTCTASTSPPVRASFTIRVNDTQAPKLTVPQNQTAGTESGKASAVVSYPAPTFSDNVPGATLACDHPSPAVYAIGATTVTCTARDTSGNLAAASFKVLVNDGEPPVIQGGPSLIAAIAPNGAVTYEAPVAHDNSAAVPAVSCAPASGAVFPVATIVTCSASDASGNRGGRSFSLVVPQAAETAPRIQAAFLSSTAFAARRAKRGGSRLSLVLTKAARVTIVIRRCTARGKRRCARTESAGSTTRDAPFGLSTAAFGGLVKGRPLARGTYRATLTATDSGGRASAARTLSFTIRGS